MNERDDDFDAEMVDLGRIALARGGHRREPSMKVQMAAINYCIREAMAATLLEGLRSGTGALSFDYRSRTLCYMLDPKFEQSDDGMPMIVAEVPKSGPIRYL